ncbi:MAG: hypothetical protein QOG19_3100 [Mycobacterium sp.]|jgi:hypothetical protein|nr:hypothetical protein [Mycobacterium sp.]
MNYRRSMMGQKPHHPVFESGREQTGHQKSRPGRRSRLLGGAVVSAVVAVFVSMVAFGASPASAAASPTGCGFATGSSGKYANTICYIDFTSYDETTARSAAGQPFTVSLGGGYTATFVLTSQAIPNRPFWGTLPASAPAMAPFSAWANQYYNSTPGQPVLWNVVGFNAADPNTGASGVKYTLSNIAVTGPGGSPVQDYKFVTGDAEASSTGEKITFSSDKNLDLLEPLVSADNPAAGCLQANTTGIGTTSVVCQGQGGAMIPHASNELFASQSPTTISQTIDASSRNGGVFGFMMSKVQLNKTVASRKNPTDSFDVSVTDGSSTLATASTGTGNSATTGQVVTLSTSTVTLAETPTGGTDLSQYTGSWQCTRNGVNDPSITPANGATSLTLAPNQAQTGDFVDCTITNTAVINTPLLHGGVVGGGAAVLAVMLVGLIGYRRFYANTSTTR